MNSRSRPVRSVAVEVVASAPPVLGLPIVRWEYRALYEKNEKFEIVFRAGKPVVTEEWVIVYFLTPDGAEMTGEFEKDPFDKFIFPSLFTASLSFWLAMTPADPLYERRDIILEDLEELRQRFRL
jgi:hypothetical protein